MSFSEEEINLLESDLLLSSEIKKSDLNIDLINFIKKQHPDILFIDKEFLEKVKLELNVFKEKENSFDNDIFIEINSFNEESRKRTFEDFVGFFNSRFEQLSSVLKQRQDLQGLTSINRVAVKQDRELVAVIGLVKEKSITKNNNIILVVEDQTGQIPILISKNNSDLLSIGKDIVLDEVIGITGSSGKNIIFANNIIFPDVPLNKEFKKGPRDVYSIFLGDTHFGSKVFLKEEFEKFIKWINGEIGSFEQKEMAKKVKYIFFAGDLVEGVGIYPDQENDLEVKDIKNQYKIMAKYFSQIPKNIKIIISPGNHDAIGIAEPQKKIYKDFAEELFEMENVIFVSNPVNICIEKTEDFSGFDILIYHGYSLIYYADNVESIRVAGGQKRVDLIMQFLLKRRHLAPTHESNQSIPSGDKDYLVVDKIPDFFVTGHIHRASASNYRNITLLNCSCWTDITTDQEKRGLEPQPGKIFLVNLQTRKVKQMSFFHKKE